MKKLTISLAGLLAMGLFLLQSPQLANAQDAGKGCSLSSLKGNFGFMVAGWNNGSGTTMPVAFVGKLIYNGSGSISGTITTVENGVVNLPSGLSGSYTINPDCTGASLITPEGSTNTSHFNQVVSGQGTMIYFIQTDNGATVTGTGNQQGQGPQ